MENTDQILDAPQAEAVRLQYAGFWIRVGAYFIDAIILGIAGFVFGMIVGALVSETIGTILNLVVGVCYFAVMESSPYQATPGKMAVGIKVGDYNGEQISFANAIGRYFAKFISFIVLCIGFMMVGWDERKQGIHDKLAYTFVFYNN